MTISFYKGLTRYPEIGNTPIWVLLIAGDWGELRIPNLPQRSLTNREGKITPIQIRVKKPKQEMLEGVVNCFILL